MQKNPFVALIRSADMPQGERTCKVCSQRYKKPLYLKQPTLHVSRLFTI